MKQSSIIFLNNLNAMMKNRGVTQAELVRRTGIGQSLLSTYVSGLRVPQLDQIDKIAAALDTTAAALIQDWSAEDVSKDELALVAWKALERANRDITQTLAIVYPGAMEILRQRKESQSENP